MSHLALQSHVACGGCPGVIWVGGSLPWVRRSVSRTWDEGTQSSVLACDHVAGSAHKDVGLTYDTGQGELHTGLGQAGIANGGMSALAGVTPNCHPAVSVVRDLCAHQDSKGKRKPRIWILRDNSRTKGSSGLW